MAVAPTFNLAPRRFTQGHTGNTKKKADRDDIDIEEDEEERGQPLR